MKVKNNVVQALKVLEPILKKLGAVLNSSDIEEFENSVVDYEIIVSDLFIQKKEQLEKRRLKNNDSCIK